MREWNQSVMREGGRGYKRNTKKLPSSIREKKDNAETGVSRER